MSKEIVQETMGFLTESNSFTHIDDASVAGVTSYYFEWSGAPTGNLGFIDVPHFGEKGVYTDDCHLGREKEFDDLFKKAEADWLKVKKDLTEPLTEENAITKEEATDVMYFLTDQNDFSHIDDESQEGVLSYYYVWGSQPNSNLAFIDVPYGDKTAIYTDPAHLGREKWFDDLFKEAEVKWERRKKL